MYVSVIGNTRLQTFPVIELEFGELADDRLNIATSRVKWDWKYQEKHKIDIVVADNLSKELQERISKISKRIYRNLSLTGYARIDLRLTPGNDIYVLEANPNPDIGYGEELSCATEAAGVGYEALLQRVINLGLRYEPETRLG